jgi:hypothetical protein
MSAFIVSTNQVMAIAASYVVNVTLSNKTGALLPVDDIFKIAKVLMKANIVSVNYRYNEKTRMPSFNNAHYDLTCSDMQILKLINCLDYQSCEVSTWNKSKAKKILDELSLTILGKLCNNAEYDHCQWTI